MGGETIHTLRHGLLMHDARNGHGTGFFDGEYIYEGENRADDLQDAAGTFGTHGVMVWVDEKGLHMDSHN